MIEDDWAKALDGAERDVKKLTQAMWDARAILGFDNDGDPTPAAQLTQGVDPFIQHFLLDMAEERKNYDDCLDELPDGAA